MKIKTLVSAGMLALSAAPGLAQMQSATSTPLASAPSISSVILNLMLVIGLVLLCGFVWMRSNFRGKQTNAMINVIANQSLGGREQVVIVQVGTEQLLLGVTAQQVTHLHTLAEPINPAQVDTQSFKSRLKAFSDRSKTKGAE